MAPVPPLGGPVHHSLIMTLFPAQLRFGLRILLNTVFLVATVIN